VQHERTGVHVTDRVDEAHDPAGTAQVQTGEGFTQRREVEERVTGERVRMIEQPVVQVDLLVGRRMEFVPRVGASPDGRRRVSRSCAP